MDNLLKLLMNNARYSVEELSAMTGMSTTDVAAKMDEYEKSGMVRAYKPLVNWEKVDSHLLTAMIEIKVIPQPDAGFEDIARKIMSFDEVETLYLMSGAFDFMVAVTGESFQEVAMFVARCLAPMQNVQSTATHFVLRRYKELGVTLTDGKEDDRRIMSF